MQKVNPRFLLQKIQFKYKLQGCIEDERQFKMAKRSQGLLVAF